MAKTITLHQSSIQFKDENGNYSLPINAITSPSHKNEIDEIKNSIEELQGAIPPDFTDDVQALKDNLTQKLTEPEGAQVGQYFRVASIDEDGHCVLEAVDAPNGGITAIKTMEETGVGGFASVTFYPDENGAITIPYATKTRLGLMKASHGLINYDNEKTGGITLQIPTNEQIKTRGYTMAITTRNIDFTVKTVMCDGKASEWTAEEREASRERQGIITCTQAEYDSITDHGSDLYIIMEE